MKHFLELIQTSFPLREKSAGEFAALKVSGMDFRIRCFEAEGLGHIGVMTASGFFGLMKMDTLIINPFQKDMPLLSYDRIRAMGKDKLYLELYNTMAGQTELSGLDAVTESYKALPDFDPGKHWYDPIKLPQSLFKKGKKLHSAAFTAAAKDYISGFLAIARQADGCDAAAKKEKAAAYSQGLLEHGGPAADVFIKRFGKETTETFFKTVLFGA